MKIKKYNGKFWGFLINLLNPLTWSRTLLSCFMYPTYEVAFLLRSGSQVVVDNMVYFTYKHDNTDFTEFKWEIIGFHKQTIPPLKSVEAISTRVSGWTFTAPNND